MLNSAHFESKTDIRFARICADQRVSLNKKSGPPKRAALFTSID